ncbi:MAG: hypothetical protein QOD00_1417 [Blastocatellia bacterium]|nr:hypothetical protein [Blastocatellia bacterium]
MLENRYFQLNKLLKTYGEKWKSPNDTKFTEAHFIDAVGLFKKLQNPREPYLQLSQYIYSKLKRATPELLLRYLDPDEENNSFLRNLAKDFNDILDDPSLYSEGRFRYLRLSAEARRLLKAYELGPEASDKERPDDAIQCLNRILLEEAYPQEISNNLFQINKIQLVNHDGYEYVKDRGNKYFYIQCLLHGAANKFVGLDKRAKRSSRKNSLSVAADRRMVRPNNFEESLHDFLIKDLQLLFGMYCFIDPRSGTEETAEPFYLTGPFARENQLTPSFTFPFFVNTRNIRGTPEFHKPPDEWLAFYLDLNAKTREQINFKDDFVKFFGSQEWRRNQEPDGPETKYNFFYASSGEMDHTILQWLTCFLVAHRIDLTAPFSISVTRLFRKKKKGVLEKAFARKYSKVTDKFTSSLDGELFIRVNDSAPPKVNGSEPEAHTIYEWLQYFGLLIDTGSEVPTERLLAAIEFFYFHLKYWTSSSEEKIGINTSSYFSRGSYRRTKNYYGDPILAQEPRCHQAVNEFIDLCEQTLPVLSKTYNQVRKTLNNARTLQRGLQEVVRSYLSALQAFAVTGLEERQSFTEYGRFNILSHFFQRNVMPLYNPLLKEETCRGFVIIPIFSNPHESTGNIQKDENTKDLGYFLGLIKDSDSKGRCYFNWRTHSDNVTESETIDFFYNEYLFHLQSFVYNLGFKEVKQIYYKGIEEKHAKEIRRQATHAAIADIINRNQAHHIGSHVSNRATLDKVLERLGKRHSDLSDKTLYLSILDLLNRLNQYRDERSEYLTYLAQYSSPSSAYLFKDVLQPFIENTLLMDNIAANENINYTDRADDGNLIRNKLRLSVTLKNGGAEESFKALYKKRDGSLLYTSEELPYLRYKTDEGFQYETVELSHPDIEVSLPGTLGKHALYSILENFIRNSAKYGRREKDNELIVYIELSNLDDPDHITVKITDNCSRIDDPRKIEWFNESIATPILERRDLGFIDMKVNACLMEGKELSDENCSKALKAGTKGGILFYEFKIAKPKQAVFIGRGNRYIVDQQLAGYSYFKTARAYIEAPISKSFKFAVLDRILENRLSPEKKQQLRSQLPGRVLYYQDVREKLTNGNNPDLLGILYRHWVAGLSNRDRSGSKEPDCQVHLTFQQSSTDRPTKNFKDCKALSGHPILRSYSNQDLPGASFEDRKHHIFYDRHGVMIDDRFQESFAWGEKKHCWILIDKNNPDLDYISRYNLASHAGLLPYELAEAGMLRVLVVDERAAEQSSRAIQDGQRGDDRMKLQKDSYGFNKFDLSKNNLTLFDTAWAANVFIATHLNEVPLKDAIRFEDGDKHVLKVNMTKDRIEYNTNITSLYGECQTKVDENDNLVKKWEIQGNAPRLTSVALRPHVLIIHRTKLKELIDKDRAASERMKKDDLPPVVKRIFSEIPNVIVTTGSGTTHGIKGHFKILPFSTVNELVLGKRVQKLRLSKILLELTRDEI